MSLKSKLAKMALGTGLAAGVAGCSQDNWILEPPIPQTPEDIIKYNRTMQQRNGDYTAVAGFALGALGRTENNPAAAWTGDRLMDNANARAGKSEINVYVNNVPDQTPYPSNVSASSPAMNAPLGKQSFDLNGNGIVTMKWIDYNADGRFQEREGNFSFNIDEKSNMSRPTVACTIYPSDGRDAIYHLRFVAESSKNYNFVVDTSRESIPAGSYIASFDRNNSNLGKIRFDIGR